ncbi:PAS domain S-box-containing protein [Ectothiorhodospira mobilis]|uniref:histidine kinase n=2 Tax=Ectothiorhodospira mobilis TaxID=195064 RepID=A0A1I4PU41_ECTMO|nr:PAS domain S-box-containing protein [Ectothiorhodospira mobilis]
MHVEDPNNWMGKVLSGYRVGFCAVGAGKTPPCPEDGRSPSLTERLQPGNPGAVQRLLTAVGCQPHRLNEGDPGRWNASALDPLQALVVDTSMLPDAPAERAFLEAVLQSRPASLPLLVLSRRRALEQRLELMQLGVSRCLGLPVRAGHLLRNLRAVLHQALPRTGHVLLLGQDDDALTPWRETLAGAGLAVQLADTPDQAAEQMQNFPAEVVVLDGSHLDVDAVNLIRLWQSDEHQAHRQYLLAGANAVQLERAAGALEGPDEMLPPPVTPTQLLRQVRLALRRARRCAEGGRSLGVALRQGLEERLRWQTRAMEAIVDGISIADATRPDMPLVYVNPAFCEMTGYAPHEVIGHNCRFLQREDNDQEGVHEIRRALAEERPARVLLRNYRKDGGMFWNEFSIAPVRNDAGTITHYVGIQQDVTEHFETQRALREAKQEAERANQAKSEFLSRMSHELRTPMNAVLGFAQLLELESDLSEAQRESVQEILRGGKHLLDLINEVLDLARVESGRMELSLGPVDLRELVGECIAMVEPLANRKGLALETGSLGDVAVLADRIRLKQILINLLSNAIKYNRSGGRVYLDLGLSDRLPGAVRIGVADTGPGIPEDRLEELFQPFTRITSASDGAAEEEEGTGIGLAISRRLAEAMGGRMGVSSRVGEGSLFWVEVPMADPGDPPSEGEAGHASASAPQRRARVCRVLQIEDHPSNLRLLERLLSGQSMQVFSARDAQAGLELARRYRPQVILLDIRLPGMDGYQVLSRLRRDPRTGDIPVVALTAHAGEEDRDRGMHAGFDAYLTKPLHLTTLLETLEDLMQRNSRPA